MKPLSPPFYNPLLSYAENYEKGPFGEFADGKVFQRTREPQQSFLGHSVYQTFGIPAGPLLNSRFVSAAFQKGFDICVYKTVRSHVHPCHPWPNVLAVHEKDLQIQRTTPVVADSEYTAPLSITNSFGVPSFPAKIWQKDMEKALKSAGKGQVMIGSFQGTSDGSGKIENYIEDFVKAALLVKETGAPILEANLSCPNEGTAHVLCFDTERTLEISRRIKKAIGNTPLILKMAYFEDDKHLEDFVSQLGKVVDGFSAINTIAAEIVNSEGKHALPGKGRERSGVCGSAITWAGLDMVTRLFTLRKKLKMNYSIIGVGGVTTPSDYEDYKNSGADAVMSATGAMWNNSLAQEIWHENS